MNQTKQGLEQMNRQQGFSITNLIVIIVAIAVLLIVIKTYAPGLWTTGQQTIAAHAGWTEEAKKADPVGFLKYSKGNLKSQQDKIGGIIKDLEIQHSRLSRESKKVASEQAKYQEVLNRARDIYRKAKQDPENGYPVDFLGAKYKKDEFLTQLKIIKDRNDAAKKQLTAMNKSIASISKSLTEMYAKRAKIQGAIEEIDTNIVIAQANKTSSELQGTISDISEINEEMNIYLGQYESGAMPIRGAEDLIKESSDSETDSDLIEFLEGGDTESSNSSVAPTTPFEPTT